jgi:hypothetical protein
MKKAEQQLINNEVLEAVNRYNETPENILRTKKLRTCSASVAETDSYYVLTSYRTVIAIIDKATDTLYDFLRYVYGYTNTSAQHISKFGKDYGKGKWGCSKVLTYKTI